MSGTICDNTGQHDEGPNLPSHVCLTAAQFEKHGYSVQAEHSAAGTEGQAVVGQH